MFWTLQADPDDIPEWRPACQYLRWRHGAAGDAERGGQVSERDTEYRVQSGGSDDRAGLGERGPLPLVRVCFGRRGATVRRTAAGTASVAVGVPATAGIGLVVLTGGLASTGPGITRLRVPSRFGVPGRLAAPRLRAAVVRGVAGTCLSASAASGPAQARGVGEGSVRHMPRPARRSRVRGATSRHTPSRVSAKAKRSNSRAGQPYPSSPSTNWPTADRMASSRSRASESRSSRSVRRKPIRGSRPWWSRARRHSVPAIR